MKILSYDVQYYDFYNGKLLTFLVSGNVEIDFIARRFFLRIENCFDGGIDTTLAVFKDDTMVSRHLKYKHVKLKSREEDYIGFNMNCALETLHEFFNKEIMYYPPIGTDDYDKKIQEKKDISEFIYWIDSTQINFEQWKIKFFKKTGL